MFEKRCNELVIRLKDSNQQNQLASPVCINSIQRKYANVRKVHRVSSEVGCRPMRTSRWSSCCQDSPSSFPLPALWSGIVCRQRAAPWPWCIKHQRSENFIRHLQPPQKQQLEPCHQSSALSKGEGRTPRTTECSFKTMPGTWCHHFTIFLSGRAD